MKKVKISHEVPFCLLTKSREFNDYDYCLPHLMDENEEYRVFFQNSNKNSILSVKYIKTFWNLSKF